MANKRRKDKTQTSISMRKDTLEAAKVAASSEDRSLSNWIETLIISKIGVKHAPVPNVVPYIEEDEMHDLPCYGDAAAGSGVVNIDTDQPVSVERVRFAPSPGAYCVNVVGGSMEPLYHDGDKVIVEPSSHADDGQIVVALINGANVIKRLVKNHQVNKLVSLNRDHPDIIECADGAVIVGVVTGKI